MFLIPFLTVFLNIGQRLDAALADQGRCQSSEANHFDLESHCREGQTKDDIGYTSTGPGDEIWSGILDESTQLGNTTYPLGHINNNPLWSHVPECLPSRNTTEEYCVYTSASFANGRGISIVTTPIQAAELVKLPVFTQPSDLALALANNNDDPLYEAQESPGRGIGLIAKKTLHKGDLIFRETPSILQHRTTFDVLQQNDISALQNVAAQRLPETLRKSVLDLCGHFGGDHVGDVMNTNAFRVEIGELGHNMTRYTGLFPSISRMNHDCRPNVAYYFDSQTLTHQAHAVRTINPGEELTITYINPSQTRFERQDKLHRHWGFRCTCPFCLQPRSLIDASDLRITLIERLFKELSDYSPVTGRGTPQMAELLVSLHEQERMDAPIANAYTLAAREWSGIGDVYNALKHAHLAVEAGLLYEGPHAEDVRDMEQLLENPSGHWTWMLRRNLKSVQL